MIPDASAPSLKDFVTATIWPGAVVITDGWTAYPPALTGYAHEPINVSACLVIRYVGVAELTQAIDGLEGQLTATFHLDTEDNDDVARSLLPHLELKAGRILVGGWPTGVDVGDAIVHGGPFPATSDGRSTSVGTAAINRWLRSVAYQNVPAGLLPEPGQEGNPWGLNRRADGRYVLAE